MRYFLIVVGLIVLFVGIGQVGVGPANAPQAENLILVGTLSLAIGLATVDIVQTTGPALRLFEDA